MGLPRAVPSHTLAPAQRSWAWALLALSSLVFLVALAGLVAGHEPFASWFYVFAWWSLILGLDGVTYLRRGSSMLLSRPLGFALLVPWSAAFWLLFELANLRLANWYYVGLPAGTLARHLGIFVSFATVLPALFQTADFLSTCGLFERRRLRPEPWRISDSRRRWMTAVGLLCAVLPLAFPRYAFPLVWGATFFLLEPWLVARGERCVWSLLAAGRPGPVLRVLAAGAICGLCWESWNYWASAKWIYSVPFFEEWKLFEMPLLGFLGFPPFALECFTFARVLVAKGLVPEWEPEQPRRVVSRARQRNWALGVTLASIPVVFAVDHWLVRSTAPRLEDFAALDDAQRDDLRQVGITDAAVLGRALRSWQHGDLLDPATLEALTREWRLAETALMGRRGVAWLASVGLTSVEELALAESGARTRALGVSGRGPRPTPTPAEVRVWCRLARRATQVGGG
jgi:hypothetical protein